MIQNHLWHHKYHHSPVNSLKVQINNFIPIIKMKIDSEQTAYPYLSMCLYKLCQSIPHPPWSRYYPNITMAYLIELLT